MRCGFAVILKRACVMQIITSRRSSEARHNVYPLAPRIASASQCLLAAACGGKQHEQSESRHSQDIDVFLMRPEEWLLRAYTHKLAIVRQSLAAAKRCVRIAPGVQAVFCRRRHQPSTPTQAKIRPGSPAPTMGAGTALAGGTNVMTALVVVLPNTLLAVMVKRSVTE